MDKVEMDGAAEERLRKLADQERARFASSSVDRELTDADLSVLDEA